jgi:predicted dithiol-disulfide oxidoreductase (DUF899 family)
MSCGFERKPTRTLATRSRGPSPASDGGDRRHYHADRHHGPPTLLDVFEGRRQLVAYYLMWYANKPAAEQCEGCTRYTTQIGDLSYLHDREVTYATLCQGPYEDSVRYREFMGWSMPWYSAQESLETLLTGGRIGSYFLVCYLRDGDRVFETYWTNGRGVEAMDYSYALMDLTAYGRQEG